MTQPPGALRQDQVQFFAEHGYLHVQHVLDAWELERLRTETARIIADCQQHRPPNDDYLYAMDPVTAKLSLRRINSMYLKGDAFLALYGHPRLLGIAESIHGPDFCTWQDAMVVKLPEYGAAVPWHRDPSDARLRPPFDADVYLDAATPDNGCLYVVPGSHLWQGFDLQDLLDEHGFWLPGAVPVLAEPGDVVLHSPNVLHGSRVTRGKAQRRIIYFAFFPIDEMLSRGGPWNAGYVRSWLKVMHRAIACRSQLPEAAGEQPYVYRPTLPEFALDPRALGHVELHVKTLRGDRDPNYRYSPLAAVAVPR